MSKRDIARRRAARFATEQTPQTPPPEAPAEDTGVDGNALFDQGIAALEEGDQAEFLSPEYMAKAEEAADLFEQSAKALIDVDPNKAEQAADVSVRLRRFLSIDWGDPAEVETSDDEVVEGANEAITASGFPVDPPSEWFANPGLTEPTPLTVTDDGRVYGHLALWNTCHTGVQHTCLTPPRSHRGYASFLTGLLRTSDGDDIAVGHITIDTKHANTRLNATRAAAHYDNTGNVAADVTVGDDAHGIWFSGAVRPNLTDAGLRTLRSAPLSGDWRSVGGNLELVAALGVNMPGFPVPRPQGLVASGNLFTLVASGMLSPRTIAETASEVDRLYLQALSNRVRERQAEAMASEVRKITTRREVDALAATLLEV